jgi:acyl-coenzyme A synthetase/AMP-(fatty) acid ligase
MIIAYYACFLLGAIAAPLRTAFKFAELAPLLQRLKPALYIGEIGLYDNVAPVDVSILAPNKRFVIDGTFEDHGVQPWEALLKGEINEPSPTAPASYKPTVLINTSGTTGQPKFVMHTPETLAETLDLMLRHWGLWEDDIVVQAFPMAHMSGLVTFLSYIQCGTSFVLLESFDADVVLDIIERYHCSWCLGFPAQYAALLERQRIRPRNLASGLPHRSGYLPGRSAEPSYVCIWRAPLQHLGRNGSRGVLDLRPATRACHADRQGSPDSAGR